MNNNNTFDNRLSLMFSGDDGIEVVKLLKQMGRKKSYFITRAIKFYLENSPDAQQSVIISSFSKSELENLFREALNIKSTNVTDNNKKDEVKNNKKEKTSIKEEPSIKEEDFFSDEKKTKLSKEEYDDVLDVLDMFDGG